MPSAALASRVDEVTRRREALTRSIEIEDAPRRGQIKSLYVSQQVRTAAEVANERVPVAPYKAADVKAYEDACAALEEAYLASQLESTDPAQKAVPWSPDEGRDVLGSETVDAKLAAWQALDPKLPFVKFAVVRGENGALLMRVGRMDVGHVDIAGGNALSAGLLQTAVKNGKTYVVTIENTSGGYRPGPLRNRTTLNAVRAAGYLATDSELTVYDNPSGSYDDSKLVTR